MTPSGTLLQTLIGVGWRASTWSKKRTHYDFHTPLGCELYLWDVQVTGQLLGFQSGLKDSATKKRISFLFLCIFEVLVVQSCPTLCDPMDCRLFCPWNSPKNTGVGLPFPPPGDLTVPGIEPWSPTLQADSLPLSHQGSPSSPWKNFIPHCTFCPTVSLSFPFTLTSLIFS